MTHQTPAHHDFYKGRDDLLLKNRIKFIGNAEERIKEDYLRILRFFRFYADFDKNNISFRADNLEDILEKNAEKLKDLSSDRITQEVVKMCKSENYQRSFLAMARICTIQELFKIRVKKIQKLPQKYAQSLPPFVKLMLIYRTNLQDLLDNKNFNFSNKQKGLIKESQRLLIEKNKEKDFLKLSVDNSFNSMQFFILNNYLDDKLGRGEIERILHKITNELPKFAISGQDLISLGVTPGKELGDYLLKIKEYWLENNFPDKEKCLEYARKILKN